MQLQVDIGFGGIATHPLAIAQKDGPDPLWSVKSFQSFSRPSPDVPEPELSPPSRNILYRRSLTDRCSALPTNSMPFHYLPCRSSHIDSFLYDSFISCFDLGSYRSGQRLSNTITIHPSILSISLIGPCSLWKASKHLFMHNETPTICSYCTMQSAGAPGQRQPPVQCNTSHQMSDSAINSCVAYSFPGS